MGLFGFGKKNNNANNSMGIKQPFFNECIVDFHKKANEIGVAERGLITIPELVPIGQNTVFTLLKDKFFQMEFGQNPQMYYYVIMTLSLQAGMVFAKKWHENYSELTDCYVGQILAEGPADIAYEILESEFSMDKNTFSEFTHKIFERWLAMHEPYWKLQDPRVYTFSAMNATYQLGISMVLAKYGY